MTINEVLVGVSIPTVCAVVPPLMAYAAYRIGEALDKKALKKK